jgi:hypothetical protein
MGSVLDPARLREMTDKWIERCAVCKVNGKVARGHRYWSDCKSQHGGLEKIQPYTGMARWNVIRSNARLG